MTARDDAAQVLAAHQPVVLAAPFDDMLGCGGCDWTAFVTEFAFGSHQADMLAAAGLPMTPEHDAQVAAGALREFATEARSHAEVAALFSDEGARGLRRAADLAEVRADRIERQEEVR